MFLRVLLLIVLTCAPVAARAGTLPVWTIDSAKSSLSFSGTQQGAEFDGHFAHFSGTIHFDPADPKGASGTITVAMASATTQSPDRDRYIAKGDWFAVDRFPTATYVIKSIDKTATRQFVAHGALTIRDKTMPINLPFTLTMEGGKVAHVVGLVHLNRLDFGIGQGEWTDTSMIGNAVTVNIDVTATRGR